MLELGRTVRFCLEPAAQRPARSPAGRARAGPAGGHPPADPPRHNGFSAWPPMRGLGCFYQVHVTCRGRADPRTGYFLNIRDMDAAVRQRVLPLLSRALQRDGPEAPLGRLMRQALRRLQPALGRTVRSLRLDLTPYYSLAIRSRAMGQVVLRQSYEFSAAHRLYAPDLSAAENARVFGKCANPSGHGHNYRLEVAVRAAVGRDGRVMPVERLDAVVDRAVIQPLDHKHLNVDVPQFARLNPSVEHIAQVVFDLLRPAVRAAGAALEEVSVWETGKTVCTVRAGAPPGRRPARREGLARVQAVSDGRGGGGMSAGTPSSTARRPPARATRRPPTPPPGT